MSNYTYNDVKSTTNLKLDQYHTILNFLNINWKLGKGKVCLLDENQYNQIVDIVKNHGTGIVLAHWIKEQNSLKKYGLTSPNKLKSKREIISKKLKEKAKRGDVFGFVGLKSEQRWNYKTQEEKFENYSSKMISKYGENWRQLSINEKSLITRLKHNTLQNSLKVQQKRKQSVLKGFENYLIFSDLGYDNYFRLYLINNKYLDKNDFVSNKGFDLIKKEKFNKLLFDRLYKEFNENKRITGISIYEDEIANLLKDNNISFIKNTYQVIKPKELDIYIPEKKIAIEFNGLYWHTTEYINKNQHLEKTELCNKKNIRLIHIFEDDWLQKRDICESIILSALGVYKQRIFARKCQFKKIDNKVGKTFVDSNHLQGSINGGEYYGLYYGNELVQIIQIGKSRFKKDEIELYRMCTKINTQVIGGFSKLMKNQPYSRIISYIDRSLYSGKGYFGSGWKFLGITKPNYCYFINSKRENRLKYQKHKLSKILEKFDPKLSEVQNMKNNHYYQIFDCGNIKVEYVKEL